MPRAPWFTAGASPMQAQLLADPSNHRLDDRYAVDGSVGDRAKEMRAIARVAARLDNRAIRKEKPRPAGLSRWAVVLVVTDPCCPFPSVRHRNDNDPFARSTVEARSAHRAAQPGTRRSSKRADDGCHPTW